MASITFGGVWLAPESAPATGVYSESADVSVSSAKAADPRWYAGGRRRIITGPGTEASVNIQYRVVSRTFRETVEAWEGLLCCYRDGRGRLHWGVFASLGVDEIPSAGEYCNLSLSFTEITHSIVA